MVKRKHVNNEPCDKEVVSIDVDEEHEEEFERAYVHEIYENISTHFSHTRYGCWKNVVKVIDSIEANSVVLDVGCGNGKYLNCRDDCYFLGVDVCSSLLEICNQRGKNNLLLSNNLKLPVRDSIADLTLSIAVIHHMSTLKRRLDAISELIRCTRRGGKILIYVWSFEQDKSHVGYREFRAQDVLVPWNLQSVYSQRGGSPQSSQCTREGAPGNESEAGGARTGTDGGDLNFKRYYHVFTRAEIDEICEHFKGSVTSTVYSDCNNWVIEMYK